MDRKTIAESDGGVVFVDQVSQLGPLTPIKVTSGKQTTMTTRIEYRFYFKTASHFYKSLAYATLDEAQDACVAAFGVFVPPVEKSVGGAQ